MSVRNLHHIPTYRKYKHIVRPIYVLYSATYNININALYRHMGPILFEYSLTGMYMTIYTYQHAYHDVHNICI